MRTYFNNSILFIFSIVIILFFSCSSEASKTQNLTVEVKYHEGKAQLYRHSEPYFIKGAAGTQHLDLVAEYGGNSIRTWNLQDADSILDKAHEFGLTVTLGLEIGRPAWGKDFSYWNFYEVNKEIEKLRPLVEKYKNHPALLMWGVGNEVKDYGGGTIFEAFYLINKVAKMVKEEDPNHPTMTAVDYFPNQTKILNYKYLLSNIDILGFNAFKSIDGMFERVYQDKGWGQAFIVSEWGTDGHWEIPATDWGAPKELKSNEKREQMEQYWDKITNDSSLLVGSYAFYWGYKYEATPTWFSLFSEEGYTTESANFLKYAWSGLKADNSAPSISDMVIETNQGTINDNVYLEHSTEYSAMVMAEDPDGDSLIYKWEIRHEGNYFIEVKGYDYNMNDYKMDHLIQSVDGNSVKFHAPKEEGPYRIFVFVYDGQGNVASHNIPFYVIMR